MEIGRLAMTLFAALIGGSILQKLRLPGGMLLGATAAAAVMNLFTPYAYAPVYIKVIAQIVTGAYIGCIMSRRDVQQLPRVVKPLILVMIGFFVLNIVVGYAFKETAHVDLVTGLFCATPGGISDTPLLAMDMGASVSKVAAVQFVRMAYGMAVLPGIVLLADRVIAPALGLPSLPPEGPDVIERKKSSFHKKYTPITLMVAAVGGVFGKASGVPAGTLVFALVTTLIYNLKTEKASAPVPLRRAAQVLSGSCIGVRITWAEVYEMKSLVLPMLIMLFGYTVFCIGMGTFLAKRYHMGLREAMLATAPAGASEMTLIAADMDVFSSKLLVIQVSRLLIVLTLFPQLFNLLLQLE